MLKPSINYERRGAIAIIRLDRPEKLNALSREMIKSLSSAFNELEADPHLRAMILTGAGERSFSAGTDITELSALVESEAVETSRVGQAICDQIESCSVPVIAAINGLAVGGGCELALACHLRLASENAQFGLPETKLGVIPGYGGTQRLAREIGRGRALEMMLTGRLLSVREALQYGLINQVTDSSALLSEAESLAGNIAKLAPLAIRACLEAVRRGLELPLKDGLAIERELFASLFTTEDMREGTRAFLEKRPPLFKGV